MVKQKGLENITVDELVQEITPKGRGEDSTQTSLSRSPPSISALVPDAIKKEMLTRLRQTLSKHEDL